MHDLVLVDIQMFSGRMWQGLLTSRSPWQNTWAAGDKHARHMWYIGEYVLIVPLLK